MIHHPEHPQEDHHDMITNNTASSQSHSSIGQSTGGRTRHRPGPQRGAQIGVAKDKRWVIDVTAWRFEFYPRRMVVKTELTNRHAPKTTLSWS
jgi:hypothetical protein